MNYASAVEKLAGKTSRKIGNNTYLERLDDETIGLRLHSTYVLKFRPGSVTLDSGGWHSVTTKDRMNYASGIRVFSERFEWFVRVLGNDGTTFADGETLDYHDGMTISQA